VLFTYFQAPTSSAQTESMLAEWNTYKKHVAAHLPTYFSRIMPGATKGALEVLEKGLNQQLPAEIKRLYMENNGEDEEWFIGGILCGTKMLTTSEILKEWNSLNALEAEFNFNALWTGDIYPDGAIRPVNYDSSWIPLFSDLNGNFTGVDLSGFGKGKKGQVINFGTDEYDHFVIADSVAEFIALLNRQYENGVAQKAIFKNEAGERVMYGLMKDSHLTDDLRSLIKK